MEGSPGQHNPFTWFTESQRRSVIRNGIVPEWFHGIISRKMSEDLLMPMPPGYFLIRVSETRFGYSLSYRTDDRCRHFMIDALEDGDYIIVGENRRHQNLQDLVDFHRRNPILPFTEVLTVACGQSSNDQADYAELLFPKKTNSSLQHNNLLQLNRSPPESEGIIPPALPSRPDNLLTATPLVPSSQPKLLYSYVQFSHIPYQPQAMIHTGKDPLYVLPPEVPAWSFVPPVREGSEGPSSPTFNQHAPNRNIQPGKNPDVKPSVVTNLKNLKKKFQKKRSKSQEHMYTEINVEATHIDEYQRIQGEQTVSSAPYSNNGMFGIGVLPPEYMPPPPFAPGH
nr:PREDICTED: hematopoietic SH2 domain-containing protein homolog [Paralichthys olivaceus]